MKNWRTTLAGCGTAATVAIEEAIRTGTLSLKTLLLTGGLAALSFLMKDHSVTGTGA